MENQKAVLDVGNCTPDHTMISAMLTSHFDVQIDRVMHVSEALQALGRRTYALVLVNRQIFADGSPGMPLIHAMQANPELRATPIMLVSNFEEAQQAAMAAGARRGFGKAALADPETASHLGQFLPPRAGVAASTG